MICNDRRGLLACHVKALLWSKLRYLLAAPVDIEQSILAVVVEVRFLSVAETFEAVRSSVML